MENSKQHSKDIDKWLRLKGAEGIGAITFGKLLESFGSVDNALTASVSQLQKVDGIGYKTAEKIFRTRNEFDVDSELDLAEKLGVWLVNIEDQRYPTLLKRIYDPPAILYVKGSLQKQDNAAISIVGSRRCSMYGQEQASRFAHFLGSAGLTIISGGARGIDTAAHQGALSSGARTIVVQGCGLAHIFPPENKKLFELISNNGAYISELPLNYEPLSENFPARNRIIAGMSLGTIVIEAGLKSGALITAKEALENNREVMAVPGKIDSPLSRGSHSLIKQGAKLIESVEDVMEALGFIGEQLKDDSIEAAMQAQQNINKDRIPAEKLNLNGREKMIFETLNNDPIHIEEIISKTSLSVGDINSSLITLRLKGLVKQLPGSMFLRG